jgi:hypothetical protein
MLIFSETRLYKLPETFERSSSSHCKVDGYVVIRELLDSTLYLLVPVLIRRLAIQSHWFHFLICAVELWVLRPLTGLLYQPRMIGDVDYGEIGGIKINRGNRSTRRKPAPATLCPPQIPHD